LTWFSKRTRKSRKVRITETLIAVIGIKAVTRILGINGIIKTNRINQRVNKIFYILIIPCFLISCGDPDVVYQNSKVIENNTWNKNESVTFDFDINDTTEFYDFYFNLRTTNLYEWSNLYMFVEIGSPEDQYNIDTVEFLLANSVGEWTGVSSGSVINNKVLFINKKRFPALGTYRLTFNQAMRQDELKEVMDVGIIIKRAVLK